MSNTDDRNIALNVLNEITNQNAYNNIALRAALEENMELTQVQRAFVTKMVNGTLQNMLRIDTIIGKHSKTPISRMNYIIRNILRISVYQMLEMDKVPVSAICNEAVNLAKRRDMDGLSGFVNGVLRSIARNLDSIKVDSQPNTASEICIAYSCPEWIVDTFCRQFGIEFTQKLLAEMNTAPDVTLCTNGLKTKRDELKKKLVAEGMTVCEGRLSDSMRVSKTSDISKSGAFKDGLFHVMDESGMLTVLILDAKPEEKVLDICAAPGGKSMYIAEKMENRGMIVSGDIFTHKLQLLEKTAERLGITIITPRLGDATVVNPNFEKYFDRVLVDAPCSGLGLIRKKPDIKVKRKPEDISGLVQVQRSILAAAADYVKPGGRLVYSTCTMLEEENMQNIQWFMQKYDYSKVDVSAYLPNGWAQDMACEGQVSLYPHVHGTDGFYIACMERN